ncbi:hypothetical protein QUF64_12465 [Anaerolineales bacterium HSG6]|nr:hypothetical protein [Anaerolineales bacterium HSG6]MDM8531951.1 hypothetical protein [Anaerolineales bacterium HSG25]
MKRKNLFVDALLLTIFLTILFPLNAQAAYLDPGSGSYIIQIIVASLAGAAVMIRMFWANIKLYLTVFFSGKNSSDADDENP